MVTDISAYPSALHQDAGGPLRLDQDAESLYAFAHLIRITEQLLLRLFEQGLLSGTTHTAIGQELCQMAVVGALTGSKDTIVSNHRNHGHFLTYSGDFLGLVAEVMGREAGVCGGRGGSQHIAYRRFHSNGVQAGMSAIAVGHALAAKLEGRDAVVASMIGDGTLGQGLVYEAMNLASVWSVPLLVVVENNGIAQTTNTATTIGGSIVKRGEAFGLRCWQLSDTQEDLFERAAEIVDEVRRSGRPGMVEIETRRLGPHSKGDDARPTEAIEEIRVRDPLARLAAKLDPQRLALIESRNVELIEKVRKEAEVSPEAKNEVTPRHYFSSAKPVERSLKATAASKSSNVRASIQESLRLMLRENPKVILLGEDLHEPYGGAFKVTGSLSSEFPGRVISTPISEAAIVGAGIGLALEGFRPIVEIMFADFTSLAFDQLYNHAVKFPALSPHSQVPLVVRTPAGGRRGYGPTHSQSPEHFLTSIPGLTVVMPSHRHDSGELLRNAVLLWDYPVVFVEHKLLYGAIQDQGEYRELPASDEDPASDLFPTLVTGAEECDVTIVSFGGMAVHAEEAASFLREQEELDVEIVLPSLLSPLPRTVLIQHLKKRRRIVLAEESHAEFGVTAEMAAALLESGFTGKLIRVGTPPVPIPSARSLEMQVIPGKQAIVSACLDLFRRS